MTSGERSGAPQPLSIDDRGASVAASSVSEDLLTGPGNRDRSKFEKTVTGGGIGEGDNAGIALTTAQAEEHAAAAAAASASRADPPPRDEKVEVFEKWLLDNGAAFPQLEIRRYADEVRGVHVRPEGVEFDEVIVEIPLKCLITVEMGKELEVGQAVIQADLDLDAPKHVFLMLFMLVDRKRPDSFFKTYYDILPATLSNMPIFWSAEELKLLEGSYLLTQIEERKFAIQRDYEAICEVYPPMADICTLKEFGWARMCVCSRNFGLDVNGLRTSALVPYADMLNHYRPRETKWTYDDERGAFTITTLQPITGGAQVYDSYGKKCNHRFLLNYGFAIENNLETFGPNAPKDPNSRPGTRVFCPNEVPFVVSLDATDPLLERKQQLWKLDGGGSAKRIRVAQGDSETTNFDVLFSLLRIAASNEEEYSEIEKGARYMYRTARDIRFPLSLRNERAVLEKLLAMVHEYLALYPTTLEQDLDKLKSDASLEPFSNERHAVIQVKGEKVVLRHYQEFAEVGLACLDAELDSDIAGLVDKRHKQIFTYCNNVLGHLRRQDKVKGARREHQRHHMPSGPTVV